LTNPTSQPTAASPAPPSPASRLIWGLISTALLAGWIGLQMGWVWALAGVVGVFVHEYGHVLVINAVGSGPGRIHIVPFVGGAASWRNPPSSEFKGVLIALAGPTFGLLAMAPFFLAFAATGQDRWLGGAFFIAIINLLNLLPAPPLDGSKALGPALARIHPWLERAAMVAIGGAVALWAVSKGDYIIGLFVGLGVLGALTRGRMRPWAAPLKVGEWLAAVGLYLVALALCSLAVLLTSGGGLPVLRRLVGV
jgi:Zn-dependent protease